MCFNRLGGETGNDTEVWWPVTCELGFMISTMNIIMKDAARFKKVVKKKRQ